MAELVMSLINVFILFFAVGYFASDMISNFLEKRKNGIVERIETARQDKNSAKKLQAEYEDKIKYFDDEKQSILADARKKAIDREAQIIESAETEAQRIINRAMREAELKKKKLRDDIKRDMIIYASATAQRLVRENMNEDRQAAMIDNTLQEMGEATWQD